MSDRFIISGPRRKHAEIVGIIQTLERQIDQHRADLIHIDAALRMLVPNIGLEEIPARYKSPQRSPSFRRGELTGTCLEAFRDAEGDGWLSAEEIATDIMRRKELDPEHDRKLRFDFNRRVLQTLDGLERRQDRVAKSGRGRGIKWRRAGDSQSGVG